MKRAIALVLVAYSWLALMVKNPSLVLAAGGILITYVAVVQIRSALHLRHRGFRVRFSGPEILLYEEATVGGKTRHLKFRYGPIAKGKLGIYWPSQEAWQREMPDWAKGRREEILDRIRQDLGSRLAKCVGTERVE